MFKFIEHIRPKKISERDLKLTETFGLGGLCVLNLIILAATGMALALHFCPEKPVASLKEIVNAKPFGWYVYNLHKFSAEANIVIPVLHMANILLRKSPKARKKTWLTGAAAFLSIYLAAISGYLISGGERAELARIVVKNLLSFEAVQNPRFLFAIHVTALPALILCISLFHFFYLRAEKKAPTATVDSKELFATETSAALLWLSVLNAAAALTEPSIGESTEKAVWYLKFLQNALKILPPKAVLSVVSLAFLFTAATPYVEEKAGKKAAVFLFGLILLLIITLSL